MSYSHLVTLCGERPPCCGLILGSGLGVIAEGRACIAAVSFADLPDMPVTSVAGHAGQIGLFEIGQSRVVIFQGRLHFYEGHSWDMVARPIRVAHELGVRTLLVTNAAGGIGTRQDAGTLMAIRNHVSANRPGWWRSFATPNGPRSCVSPYSDRLLSILNQAAVETGQDLPVGTYASLTGPCYETAAEIRALRAMGVDAVGMSTSHEVETAFALGMESAAVSCITNRAAGLSDAPLNHQEVLATARAVREQFINLLWAFIRILEPNTARP